MNPSPSPSTASITQLRKISELEAAGRNLASANQELRQEISEHERLEGVARMVERGLQEVRERFESAFDNAPIGMALIAMDDRWLQVNAAMCRITGPAEEALKATTLRAMTHAEDVDIDAENLQQLRADKIASYQVEKRYRHAWGHHVWVLVTTSVVRDGQRNPLYLVTQVQDITERKELAERLEYLADHDFLTGLFDRRHFEQELAKEIERVARYGAPGAVLVIDLDNFKDINDTFGHKAGDNVLKGVAGLLRHRLRQTDVVARIGGDEFAILLPQTDAGHALRVADEVVKALGRQTAVLADHSARITASIGVTMFDGLTDIEVLAYADLAMYEAKEAGRNRYAIYRPITGGRVHGSTRLVEAERIRQALEEDRLILYCQPILDLGKNEICQYELLLRLPDQDGGEPLPPSAFLYGAERFGLIQSIDAWVVRKAIQLVAEHTRAGRDLMLHVNLSGKSIGDPKLAAFVEEALAEAGIDPRRLIFELTETTAIANVEEARRSRAGCGREAASWPWTTSARASARSTTHLLRRIGVDCAQGYHIGMPRPVSEVLQTTG